MLRLSSFCWDRQADRSGDVAHHFAQGSEAQAISNHASDWRTLQIIAANESLEGTPTPVIQFAKDLNHFPEAGRIVVKKASSER